VCLQRRPRPRWKVKREHSAVKLRDGIGEQSHPEAVRRLLYSYERFLNASRNLNIRERWLARSRARRFTVTNLRHSDVKEDLVRLRDVLGDHYSALASRELDAESRTTNSAPPKQV
jgi:hypothetical protein